MNLLEFLEKRIGELKEEKAQAQDSMATIREKIKNADAKRGNQPETEHYHKWSSILKGLEKDLDRVRSVVVGREAEIEQKETKLAELKEAAASQSQAGADISKRILEMTDEEVANLTMEDIALLQEYELSLAAEEKANEPQSFTFEPVEAEEEQGEAQGAGEMAAVSTPPPVEPDSAKEGSAPISPRPQAEDASRIPQLKSQLIATAVKKLARDMGNVTLAELHAAIDGYAALRNASELDPEKERLKGALGVAMEKIRKEITRVAAKLGVLHGSSGEHLNEGNE